MCEETCSSKCQASLQNVGTKECGSLLAGLQNSYIYLLFNNLSQPIKEGGLAHFAHEVVIKKRAHLLSRSRISVNCATAVSSGKIAGVSQSTRAWSSNWRFTWQDQEHSRLARWAESPGKMGNLSPMFPTYLINRLKWGKVQPLLEFLSIHYNFSIPDINHI